MKDLLQLSHGPLELLSPAKLVELCSDLGFFLSLVSYFFCRSNLGRPLLRIITVRMRPRR